MAKGKWITTEMGKHIQLIDGHIAKGNIGQMGGERKPKSPSNTGLPSGGTRAASKKAKQFVGKSMGKKAGIGQKKKKSSAEHWKKGFESGKYKTNPNQSKKRQEAVKSLLSGTKYKPGLMKRAYRGIKHGATRAGHAIAGATLGGTLGAIGGPAGMGVGGTAGAIGGLKTGSMTVKSQKNHEALADWGAQMRAMQER